MCIYPHKSQWFSLCKEWRGVDTDFFFSFFLFKPHEKPRRSGRGSQYDSGRKVAGTPALDASSLEREGNSDRPAESQEARKGSWWARKGGWWAETLLIPVAKNTCHEFYLNNTGVHSGRAKRTSTENVSRHNNLEGTVPEYFLFDYQGLGVVVITWGQQEQARCENVMLGGSIVPPLDLHQDTDRHTHRLKYTT